MTVNVANDWIQQLYVREFGNKLLPTDYYYNDNGIGNFMYLSDRAW